MDFQHIVHPFPALYAPDSKILILGSFPSVKSREANFFYGHPQNRFWKVLAQLFSEDLPLTIEEKSQFLYRHQIALWDVIYSCDIHGSSDSSIRNAVATDLGDIIRTSCVTRIFCNGQTSGRLFEKYQHSQLCMDAIVLPSTSPANAAWSLERLCDAWKIIL